jgi:small-conductance mechanosensitive channel
MNLRVCCPDPVIGAGVKYDLTEAVKKRFDTGGIEIPFAYQNVVVKSLPTSAPARKPEKKDENC